MIKIPANIRSSNIEVRVPIDGEHGGEHAESAQLIEGVRYESANTVKNSSYVFTDGAAGVLYIDATSNNAFDIPVGALVSIDGGAEVCVTKCSPFYDFMGHLHHWECEVK